MAREGQWTRFVAIGDSFTEGIGDPDGRVPGGHRGWADRVAEQLAASNSFAAPFLYANLAIRGRLLGQIIDEQLEPARAERPDLVSLCAGGNDILRPGANPAALAERLETAVAQLRDTGATLLLFTGPDVGGTPIMTRVIGKARDYNSRIRGIAERHGAVLVDLAACTDLADRRMWAEDRLHLSTLGHRTVARLVLDRLRVAHTVAHVELGPAPQPHWGAARRADLEWACGYFAPWVMRRIRGTSSGDGVLPKRPVPTPVDLVDGP